MFFIDVRKMLNKMTKPFFFYNYLYRNGIKNSGFNSFFNKGPLFDEALEVNKSVDYFTLSIKDKISTLVGAFQYLSDECMKLSLPSNRFNHIMFKSYFNIDSFISSYTSLSSYYDFNIFNDSIYNLKFPYHVFFMLSSQK